MVLPSPGTKPSSPMRRRCRHRRHMNWRAGIIVLLLLPSLHRKCLRVLTSHNSYLRLLVVARCQIWSFSPLGQFFNTWRASSTRWYLDIYKSLLSGHAQYLKPFICILIFRAVSPCCNIRNKTIGEKNQDLIFRSRLTVKFNIFKYIGK